LLKDRPMRAFTLAAVSLCWACGGDDADAAETDAPVDRRAHLRRAVVATTTPPITQVCLAGALIGGAEA
jgi:hypothetical protein